MKKRILITLLSIIIQSMVITVLIIKNPTPFVDGLVISSGMIYAPIASIAFAGIIITLVRKKNLNCIFYSYYLFVQLC